jgi:hypothetical protein
VKHLVTLAVIAVSVGCSSPQRKTEQPVPQCLSLCSNQFAACTDEYPGDFSACKGERADCEQTCREQKALQETEEEEEEVIVPTDSETTPAPEGTESGPEDSTPDDGSPDDGSTPDSDETPE